MEASVSAVVDQHIRLEDDEKTILDPLFGTTEMDDRETAVQEPVRARVTGAKGRPERTVTQTSLIGPKVGSLANAIDAIRFYAKHPEAQPRASIFDRALLAIGTVFSGARMVVRNPAVRSAALLPTVLSLLGCAVVALLAAVFGHSAKHDSALKYFLVTFIACAALPPTILHGHWLQVALAARKACRMPPGKDELVGTVRGIFRELAKMFRQSILVAIGLAPLVIFLRWLPGGRWVAAGLALVWAMYWVAINAFDFVYDVAPGLAEPKRAPWFARIFQRAPMLGSFARLTQRCARPWRHEVAFSEAHPGETAGFGIFMGAVLAVPVLGLLMRPVAIVAATQLTSRVQTDR